MRKRRFLHARAAVLGIALLVTVVGCSSLARSWRTEQVAGAEPGAVAQAGTPESVSPPISHAAPENADTTVTPYVAEADAPAAPRPVVRLGTGRFVKPDDSRRYQVTATPAGDISLNFEQAELRQVVMVILGELLGETYYMDPTIKGTVTVQNDESLRRDQLLPILEELL